ncbi:MAG: hypothetical protein HQ519_05005 [Planctomycetes bacterium]|nr:hypothetical protein [Planctomycetota bacterium]NQU47984.1 hypothetical protein [Planctomycetota bacterium]
MTHQPENDRLSEELELAFHSLAKVSAPPELADRVRLSRLGSEKAPAELWDRVEMAAFGKVDAPEGLWEKVLPEVKRQSWTTRVFRFPRRLAAAAAIMLAIGIGYGLSPWAQPQQDMRMAEYAALKEETLSQYVLIEVEPNELSSSAATMAGSLGGSLKPGGLK